MDATIVKFAVAVLYLAMIVMASAYASPHRLTRRWGITLLLLVCLAGFLSSLGLFIAGLEAWLGPRGGIR